MMNNRIPQVVLVTGGCGFIGSNFINHIAKEWPETLIINVDKLAEGSDVRNVEYSVVNSSRYVLIVGDIGDQQLMTKVFHDYKIDTVINFAANSHVDACYKDPTGSTENNILGMVHLLESCRKLPFLPRFIHISSDEVYGDSDLGEGAIPKKETDILVPTNPYAASKASCEAMLTAYACSYGMKQVILRVNNVFGPRQWVDKVIPCFIKKASLGEAFPIMGNGEQLRSWIYVEDACKAIRLLSEKGIPGEIYNVGTREEESILSLAQIIYKEVSATSPQHPPFRTKFLPDRPYNDRRYLLDTQKAKKLTGWEANTDLVVGLKRTIQWYLNNQEDHFMIFGGKGWIGAQLEELVRGRFIKCTLAKTRPGDDSDEKVEEEIRELSPTHVICLLGRTKGEGCGSIEYLEGKLDINLRDNLYAVCAVAFITRKLGIHMTYVGTGCIFEYNNEHPVGGTGYTEKEVGNYKGNSYSVVKGYTDRLMMQFDHVLNARIRLPFNWKAEARNLVYKVMSFKKIMDIPDSITSLPHILPALVQLILQKQTGTVNMTNPGTIRHSQTLEMHRSKVGGERTWSIVSGEEEKKMLQTRAHCCLDTTLLKSLVPHIPTAEQAMEEAITKILEK